MTATAPATAALPLADVQTSFVRVLPRIRRHARYALRHVRSADARADLVAEAVALAWKHFAALCARGKDPGRFASTLALRCTQAVRGGRRLAGSDRTTDVLSPVARARH